MARPIAGINDYPYGMCGYIVNGVHFHNKSTSTNLRIYKQRSDVMFDLIDPTTMNITQKILLTGTDIFGNALDYSLSDMQLVNMIPRNTFFVRGYNSTNTVEGFVVRWLLNKKILSNGKVLFDIYVPECGIPPSDISNIVVNPVQEGDVQITGIIIGQNGTINTTDMLITVTLQDGSKINGVISPDGTFYINIINPITVGDILFEVTSPNYKPKNVVVSVIADDNDSEYTTELLIPTSRQNFINDVYVSTVPAIEHGRGVNLVIQLQTTDLHRSLILAEIEVVNGNITIKKEDSSPFYILLIGSTLKTTPFVQTISWEEMDDGFVYRIPKSVHQKTNISFTVYDGNEVSTVESVIENDEEIVLRSEINFNATIVITGK